jgi:GTPase Era involved in 16S rRNA processing
MDNIGLDYDPFQADGTCVVLVGTTGTGKTTCLNLYTGQALPTGDSPQSVTRETVAVTDLRHGSAAPRWVDNPGWSDTEGNSDANAFKDSLRHLQDNGLSLVKAVLWFVMPTPRMDAMLQQQAEYATPLLCPKLYCTAGTSTPSPWRTRRRGRRRRGRSGATC